MKPGRVNCTGKGIEVGWKGCKGGMGSKETGGCKVTWGTLKGLECHANAFYLVRNGKLLEGKGNVNNTTNEEMINCIFQVEQY